MCVFVFVFVCVCVCVCTSMCLYLCNVGLYLSISVTTRVSVVLRTTLLLLTRDPTAFLPPPTPLPSPSLTPPHPIYRSVAGIAPGELWNASSVKNGSLSKVKYTPRAKGGGGGAARGGGAWSLEYYNDAAHAEEERPTEGLARDKDWADGAQAEGGEGGGELNVSDGRGGSNGREAKDELQQRGGAAGGGVLQSAFCSGGDGGGEAIQEAVPEFDWSGFQRHVVHMKLPLLTIIGSKGWAACAYVDVETANKTGEAVAVFSGVKDHAAFLTSAVKRASEAAAALGIVEGMNGAEALSLLR